MSELKKRSDNNFPTGNVEHRVPGRLAGRKALVTGASRGIGAEAARAFASEGAAVALCYEPRPEMRDLAFGLAADLTEGGATAVAFAADLSNPDDIEDLVRRSRDALGGIDIVVANAAAQQRASWRDISVAEWDHMQSVNVRGTWLLARAAYPALRASACASIITVTSVMVETGQVGALHYTASKAAVIGITRALSRELGGERIRVNAVMPGAIRTEYEEGLVPDGKNFGRLIASQALERRGLAKDVAGVFTFLASDESSFVTGQVVNVDGGWVHY
ncbi:SDR family NAD(P)-dependent oxidoreductase [Ruania alba]|uniref:3-oxoacyl-[acyl-carrier protein] reductase n=1 Tax=Ruania alba TaxID=648782 RepID=A0A1H5M2R9_9MICO|nr:SDR family oxidoreductase [Ruania alba]SEE83565.1 3-oxoacyl-[acyl-carrier protein] reductase [Ruania alba]